MTNFTFTLNDFSRLKVLYKFCSESIGKRHKSAAAAKFPECVRQNLLKNKRWIELPRQISCANESERRGDSFGPLLMRSSFRAKYERHLKLRFRRIILFARFYWIGSEFIIYSWLFIFAQYGRFSRAQMRQAIYPKAELRHLFWYSLVVIEMFLGSHFERDRHLYLNFLILTN